MQSVDFTTLTAACAELRTQWLPARIEQVYQRDRYTIALALRTLDRRGWLTLCWHPQAARICLGDAPPRTPDTFTFSDQLRHQLNGYALIAIDAIAPWERVVDLQFAKRPGDPPQWHPTCARTRIPRARQCTQAAGRYGTRCWRNVRRESCPGRERCRPDAPCRGGCSRR
ncbi:MAG: NFACT family protein, partial [Hydrococcus sp. Prado102]|nr:NFACT family protein [Hydrococcus sp. Prado102]